LDQLVPDDILVGFRKRIAWETVIIEKIRSAKVTDDRKKRGRGRERERRAKGRKK